MAAKPRRCFGRGAGGEAWEADALSSTRRVSAPSDCDVMGSFWELMGDVMS
jgi:hypothetical protein